MLCKPLRGMRPRARSLAPTPSNANTIPHQPLREGATFPRNGGRLPYDGGRLWGDPVAGVVGARAVVSPPLWRRPLGGLNRHLMVAPRGTHPPRVGVSALPGSRRQKQEGAPPISDRIGKQKILLTAADLCGRTPCRATSPLGACGCSLRAAHTTPRY